MDKRVLTLSLGCFLLRLSAQAAPLEHYALIFRDDPAAAGMPRRAGGTGLVESRRQGIAKSHRAIEANLHQLHALVTGSAEMLLNAVFVIASPDSIPQLQALPDVAAVVPMPRLHRQADRVIDLVNIAPAWAALGAERSGAGIKIAVIDSGIDETHPGFLDPSLAIPDGYPKTDSTSDRAHTTNKIIVARSFVAALANGDGTAESTAPDDLSVRDRVGHGTAVAMIAAGVSHQSPMGLLSGVAPQAWLGNYKVFGSPGVNDTTTADIVLLALDAAYKDGMDIAIVSAGSLSAMWSPSDQGSACATAAGVYCDPWAGAVTLAAQNGMIVVTPAGNDGAFGLGTINTPGDVPAVITVGAATSAQRTGSTLRTPGAPASDRLSFRLGDGPKMSAPLIAPLRLLTALASTELACLPLPSNSLAGAVVLIARGPLVTRGNCSFFTKVMNASRAGALAALIYADSTDQQLFELTGLDSTAIPAALVSTSSAALLKDYVAAQTNPMVTLDPATQEIATTQAQTVAPFSSRGPNIGDGGIKPELTAPGVSIYTAAQRYDPNGDLYSPDGYVGVDGTSFAAAFVGGAAALVKQAHPGYSAAQIKSAVVNTASLGLLDPDTGTFARVSAVGAGMLNAGAAVAATITIEPATVSFGVLTQTPLSKNFAITNTGAAGITLQLAVTPADAAVVISPPSVTLAAGQSAQVTATITGAPSPGSYEGVVMVTGGPAPLRIPYLYLVGDGIATSLIPLSGRDFVTETSSTVHVALRAVDRYGVPVSSIPVRFSPPASVYAATLVTDVTGVAEAYITTPDQVGEQSLGAALASGVQVEFNGRTRSRPQISAGGVVDAASFRQSAGFAPGSYISIFGSNLSETSRVFVTPYLPVSLSEVSVSFDVPSLTVHVPGRIYFTSGGQISVQIPWELAGATSALMKVTLNQSASRNVRPDNPLLGTYQTSVLTIPIASASPAFFEYLDTPTGKPTAAALDESNSLIGSANPVSGGQFVQFFLNGLGDVLPGTRPLSGEMTPATLPLATTLVAPAVTIGGQPARVQFSGLTPNSIGLYQVNVEVPTGIAAGLQPVTLSMGETTAPVTTLWVR